MIGIFSVFIGLLVLFGVILAADLVGHRRVKSKDFAEEHFHQENLCEACREAVNDVLNSNLSELNLNHEETKKRELQQVRLRKALRQACLGDAGDREYLKEYLKDILQKKLGLNEKTISLFIPFENADKMTPQDKFEHMYTLFRHSTPYGTIGRMIQEFKWDEPKKSEDGRDVYIIDEDDIVRAYRNLNDYGNYNDRLDTVVQRCYQKLFGHDCADILIMDEALDGVSAGVGGKTRVEYNYLLELSESESAEKNTSRGYDTIYCVLHGKLIRMKFLSFGKEQTLERVVKNIYRYNSKTTLSQKNPILHGTFKNGSRVVVARPPVSDGWAFYIRKFMSADAKKIENLLVHKNREIVIELLKYITMGELNFVISGPMGGGKTTLLKALVGFMNPQYTIRVAESSFELNINNVYPERNIHVMQERGNYSIYDIITGTKKMDTDILIVGEVNEPKIAGAYIQVAQSGSRMAVTTLHHETTQKLIEYLRNALVTEFGINNVEVAEKQVVDILNFDVHMVHDIEGRFYIERITEIIPDGQLSYPDEINSATKEYFRRRTDRHAYRTENIIEFDKDSLQYRVCATLSEYTCRRLSEKLGMQAVKLLNGALNEMMGGVGY